MTDARAEERVLRSTDTPTILARLFFDIARQLFQPGSLEDVLLRVATVATDLAPGCEYASVNVIEPGSSHTGRDRCGRHRYLSASKRPARGRASTRPSSPSSTRRSSTGILVGRGWTTHDLMASRHGPMPDSYWAASISGVVSSHRKPEAGSSGSFSASYQRLAEGRFGTVRSR